MSKANLRRERMEGKRKQQKRKSTIIWGLFGIATLGLIGLLLWNNLRPTAGIDIPTLRGVHINDAGVPVEYNSDPPTSGPHTSPGLDAGFYEESDLPNLPSSPERNLVHNLEHGYIVFWYNCELLENDKCNNIKDEVREYIDRSLVIKLIAFPWKSIEVPLALTSWGHLLEMDSFDASLARNFVSSNRLRAPEPNAR